MNLQVTSLDKPIRLDVFLQSYLKITRSQVKKLFLENIFYLNSKVVKKIGIKVNNADEIKIIKKTLKHQNHETFNLNLSKIIVYEDQDLIVINKPKDLLVHATKYENKKVLWNFLKDRLDSKAIKNNERFGIFQRIDRNTTGLLVIAKNQKSYDNLYHQLASGILIRKYLAIVHGHFQEEQIIINVPLIRQANSSKMMPSDDPKAKEAYTIVKVLSPLKNNLSLVECQLKTGRTHQIRVHLNYIKHPVFNDDVYGKDDGIKNYHQFLHSYYLSFDHPISQKHLEFKIAPDRIFCNLINDQEILKKYVL